MAVHTFAELVDHIGHEAEIVAYGKPMVNVAIECMDCGEVLLDFDANTEEFEAQG